MCDTLVALPTATGGATLFAKNSDRPPAERQVIEWSEPRVDRDITKVTHIGVAAHPRSTLRCLISRPTWCWGAEHGVNEAGVAIGNEAIYTIDDPRQAAPALIGMDLVRLGLERSQSAHAAVTAIVDLLERYGQGGSGHDPMVFPSGRPYWSSFLIADAVEAWVIETSGRRWATERVVDARAISNRTTIPEFDASYRHPRQPVERLVDPRWHASQHALAQRPVTVAALQRHLRSHDSCAEPGWSVCMHVPGVEQTTASMVVELPPHAPFTAWMLTGSPCENDYVAYRPNSPEYLTLPESSADR